MKKPNIAPAAALFLTGALLVCGLSPALVSAKDEKLQIVTTIFPEYDWAKNLLGDNPAGAELTLLMDSGVDLHSFQPTVDDIVTLSTCDLFVYVGGESDGWVADVLKQASNPDMKTVNLLEVLGDAAKEEELVEGMESEHEHEEEGGEEETGFDEHVWLSLRNASVLCGAMEAALEELDPSNAEVYQQNLEEYTGRLDALDQQYEEAVSNASVDTLLFGDRFPFRYLVDDYGLSYYAAFAGCSAETEASFETITFLSRKADELSLHNIMTIEGTDQSIADTIVQNTSSQDQNVLIMDSMQSVTSKDIENGATYLSIMESNLEILKQALA